MQQELLPSCLPMRHSSSNFRKVDVDKYQSKMNVRKTFDKLSIHRKSEVQSKVYNMNIRKDLYNNYVKSTNIIEAGLSLEESVAQRIRFNAMR